MVVNDPEEPAKTNENSFIFRLHCVRHGETEGNRAGIVLGQIDSPLTRLGIQQAKAAHQSFGKDHKQFWRIFSSDLGRCIRTSNLILGLEENEGSGKEDKKECDRTTLPFTLDKRLRERAKGVREGQNKYLTYDEAMEIYQKRKRKRECDGNKDKQHVPLLENDDQVMDRVNIWLEETIRDAYSHYCSHDGCKMNGYDVLVISHSGTLRILIENLVGKQLPRDVDREKEGKGGSKVLAGRLIIPNTSKTIIEFKTLGTDEASASLRNDTNGHAALGAKSGKKFVSSFDARLIEFANVSHFDSFENIK